MELIIIICLTIIYGKGSQKNDEENSIKESNDAANPVNLDLKTLPDIYKSKFDELREQINFVAFASKKKLITSI